MANLYEINKAMLECVDSETGELLDAEKLEQLSIEREEKITNLAEWVKNLESDAESFSQEKKVFEEREKAALRKAESIKKYLADFLNGQKFSSETVEITFRKSCRVSIAEGIELPPEYMKYKIEVNPDKSKIAAALKSGEEIAGCAVETVNNITIK